MDKDKRVGWIRDLKEGDKVFVKDRHGEILSKVEKITTTGRINTSHYRFTPNGVGGDTYNHHYLVEWTQEKEDEFNKKLRHRKLCSYLRNTEWDKLNLESIIEIYRITKEKRRENEKIRCSDS
jgi:tryptophanyl-tRNA synthetase